MDRNPEDPENVHGNQQLPYFEAPFNFQIPSPYQIMDPSEFQRLFPYHMINPYFDIQEPLPFQLQYFANYHEPPFFQPSAIYTDMQQPPMMRPITKRTETSEKPTYDIAQFDQPIQPSTSHGQTAQDGYAGAIPKRKPPQLKMSETAAKTSTPSSGSVTEVVERSLIFLNQMLEGSTTLRYSELYEQLQSVIETDHPKSGVTILAENVDRVHRQRTKSEICPIPTHFDSFILEDLIGCGSFANVYRAFDKNTDTVVAIKSFRLKKNCYTYFSRIALEAAFLKILSHPNIVRYICSYIRPEYNYIAVEYSPHDCLRKLMKNFVGMREIFVHTVMNQLLSAMYYLHTMYIVHGDIKPDNIIVFQTEPLMIKLTDFGISEVSLNNELFREKSGSFLYMAPELHLGYPSDYKSDLFSAGVMMYEMLFGFKPFRGTIRRSKYILNFKRRCELVIPESANRLTAHCVDLVKNLLSYDKYTRLHGEELLRHPFLQIDPIRDVTDHQLEAYKCFLKGAEFAEINNYGHAYTEMTAAVLHLQIFSNGVFNPGLRKYIFMKLEKYKKYCYILEERLSTNTIKQVDVSIDTEQLRCLLQPEPILVAAFDSCAIGEMYYWLKNLGLAEDMLRKGFRKLSFCLKHEPEGERKNLLSDRLNHWFRIMEDIRTGCFRTSGNSRALQRRA